MSVRLLIDIKHRYFRNGILTHQEGCNIYRSLKIWETAPCTCGLLHDLGWLNDSISVKIYPEQWDDFSKQNGLNPEDSKYEDSENIIKEIFGDQPVLDTSSDWEIILEVFGQEFVDKLKSR